jgi:hypothetical protein
MSSVTRTWRFCAVIIGSRAICEYCIMHNGDMQDSRSLAHLVHNPRRYLLYYTYPRRDYNRCRRNRSRSRRT